MKFKVGDRVKINKDFSTASGTATAGAVGTVIKVLTVLQLDQVQFDTLATPLKVPEDFLDPA